MARPIEVLVAALLGLAPLAAPLRAQTAPPRGAADSAPVAPVGGAAGAGGGIAAEYLDAARLAWRFVVENTDSATGLVRATPEYGNATTWDVASAMGAIWSAHRLDIIDGAEYRARMTRLLETIAALPLYDDAAYHKVYEVATGRMVSGGRAGAGYAWSATDLGRFLVWLAIVRETDPQLAPLARRIAGRMDYRRIVQQGYVHGYDENRRVYKSFQEGRVGYEQYMGRGFALWGHDVEPMLDPHRHGRPVEVMGHTLLEDERGYDRLVSEPFVMMGLELGWDAHTAELARNVLAVQRARWERTGHVTIASEDALSLPPNYFYYYCVYCSGRAFVIETHEPGETRTGPRWVSTKNAFGWHALVPDDYTELAFRTVQGARGPDGWSSGVFEGNGRSTGTRDINTAAVILESAAYIRSQRPLIQAVP
jgi:hypothetical protein